MQFVVRETNGLGAYAPTAVDHVAGKLIVVPEGPFDGLRFLRTLLLELCNARKEAAGVGVDFSAVSEIADVWIPTKQGDYTFVQLQELQGANRMDVLELIGLQVEEAVCLGTLLFSEDLAKAQRDFLLVAFFLEHKVVCVGEYTFDLTDTSIFEIVLTAMSLYVGIDQHKFLTEAGVTVTDRDGKVVIGPQMDYGEDMSVDEFIDTEYGNHKYARWVLNAMRMPATLQIDFAEFTAQYKLFVTWNGGRYEVTSASRLGTIQIQNAQGDARSVRISECSEWSDKL